LRSNVLTSFIKAKVFRFNKRRIIKLKLVYLKYKVADYQQIPDLYINSLNKLKILPDGLGLEFWLDKDLKNNIYPYKNLNKSNSLKIALAPGAHHFTKRWIKEKYIELCKELIKKYDPEINLIGGIKDKILCSEICESVNGNCISFAGKIGLAESAEVINGCDITITNDTSIMHISAARQVPVVAIFGSTIPDFGFSPYKVQHKIVQKDIQCRPCTHIGKKKCPKGHFNCMNSIEVYDVIDAVSLILH
jgi:heptosyltransferase-2